MSDRRAPELRVSDADREGVAERLRHAAGDGQLTVQELDERLEVAYRARTFGELEPLTADLQARDRDGALPVAERRFTVRRGPGGAHWLLASHARLKRRGRWRIARRCTLLNVLGHGDLDLSEIELADDRVELRVVSIMGGADIRVPDGLRVEVARSAALGVNRVDVPEQPASAFEPLLRVRLVTLLGRARVTRVPALSHSAPKGLRAA